MTRTQARRQVLRNSTRQRYARRGALCGAIAVVLVGLGVLVDGARGAPKPQVLPAGAASLVASYGILPLRFEPNRGQSAGPARFLARGAGYSVFLTQREVVLSLAKPSQGARQHSKEGAAVVRMRMIGANPRSEMVSTGRLSGTTNYAHGSDRRRWKTGVPGFSRVTYRSAYPGIDAVFYGRQRQLEYDFVVAPGGKPGRIALGFEGAKRVELSARGDLMLHTSNGVLRQHRPVAYQRIGASKRAVSSRYVLDGRRVRLRVGAYDRSRPLVIDPVVSYASYLGGAGTDSGLGVAADPSGAAYVTGSTTAIDFPTRAPAQAGNGGGDSDVFVSKVSSAGTELVYSTYFGGGANPAGTSTNPTKSSVERGQDIAADATGNAYVTGVTEAPGFPTTTTAYRRVSVGNGDSDAFVVKLDSAGKVVYSTLLGTDAKRESGGGIAVLPSCSAECAAYVTGSTGGATNTFPRTTGAFVSQTQGTGFLTKLSSSGGALDYSAIIDAPGADVAVDQSGSAYVTGGPIIDGEALSSAPNAYQDPRPGKGDAFLSRLKADGSALLYSTYLGGATTQEQGRGVAVDSSNNAYVTGLTGPANHDASTPTTSFPTTESAFARTATGAEAFVTKLDTAVSGQASLRYSTVFGGSRDDDGSAIAVDSTGKAYVTGYTRSSDFPVKDSVQSAGHADAYVAKFNTTFSGQGSLVYSTRLGGTREDKGANIAVDASGSAYVVGQTVSGDFPWVRAFQEEPGVGTEGFLAKLVSSTGSPVITGVSPRGGPSRGGTPVTVTGTGFVGVGGLTFGDRPASYRVVSDTQITTTSPPHADGTVSVRATSPSGTSPRAYSARFHYGPWSQTGRLSVPRLFGHTATLLKNGKVLVTGGAGAAPPPSPGAAPGVAPLASVDVYDPRTGSWTAQQAMTTPRYDHTATLLENGKVLMAGGVTGPAGEPTKGDTAELYDPATGASTKTTSMPYSRYLHTATLITGTLETCGPNCGKVLVAGGRDEGGFSRNRAELYNPVSEQWEVQADMNSTRSGHIAALLPGGPSSVCGFSCGNVLAVGSYGVTLQLNQTDARPDLFDPKSTGLWRPASAPVKARYSPSGVLLGDGRMLVLGGARGLGTAFREAEAYNASDDSWMAVNPLIFPRNRPAVALLPSEKVLVAGGSAADGRPLASAELYDPAAGGTAIGPMLASRSTADGGSFSGGPTATLLSGKAAVCVTNCGKVLVVGGSPESVTELYSSKPVVGKLSPVEGPATGGTAVTLEGSSMAGVTSVKFGNVEALKVTPDSETPDTKLVAISPAQPQGTVPVTLTTDGGTTVDTQSTRFTYTPAAAAGPTTTAPAPVVETPSSTALPSPAASAPAAAPGPSALPSALVPLATPDAAGAAALAGERRRARALRRCLSAARRHLARERRLSRRGTARRRALATRHFKSHARRLPAACRKRYGRTPGTVSALTARAASPTEIVLNFRAAGSDGAKAPPARSYLVKQSTRPIIGTRAFKRAQSLCKGSCRFPVTETGEKVELRVTDLKPRTTYYFAVAARDNVSRRLGRHSRVVRVATR